MPYTEYDWRKLGFQLLCIKNIAYIILCLVCDSDNKSAKNVSAVQRNYRVVILLQTAIVQQVRVVHNIS